MFPEGDRLRDSPNNRGEYLPLRGFLRGAPKAKGNQAAAILPDGTGSSPRRDKFWKGAKDFTKKRLSSG